MNTLLKICGIRSLEEIMELKELDIDYFGCIFAESPRKISIELAEKITSIAHKHNKKTVGVFVNENLEKIIEIVQKTGIDRIQLHGNETPEYCFELLEKLKDLEDLGDLEDSVNSEDLEDLKKLENLKDLKNPETSKTLETSKIWKVFSVKNELPNIAPYLKYIEYPLFDTKGENKGGNGIVFNWEILKELNEQKFILAGGLSEENIKDALNYKPAILDVNSKVEINNRKNRSLIEQIIKIVK